MSDLIERQVAIDVILEDKIPDKLLKIMTAIGGDGAETLNMTCDRHAKMLMSLPSAYPEIIRCKDCKHWINDHLCESLSRFGSFEPKADFYCGFAKRKTDGEVD